MPAAPPGQLWRQKYLQVLLNVPWESLIPWAPEPSSLWVNWWQTQEVSDAKMVDNTWTSVSGSTPPLLLSSCRSLDKSHTSSPSFSLLAKKMKVKLPTSQHCFGDQMRWRVCKETNAVLGMLQLLNKDVLTQRQLSSSLQCSFSPYKGRLLSLLKNALKCPLFSST